MASNNADLHINIRATENVSATAKAVQSSIIRMVGAVSSVISTLQVIAFPVRTSTEFERAMADVRKTTGFTSAEIKNLSSALVEMSSRLAVSQVSLASIAATAGQLGLGRQGVDAIHSFTESVARATVTFGLGEDQVATYASQLLNIFNIDTSRVENLFSSINELSNNSVASAQNLFDVMKRVGNIAGLTAEEVGGLAAATADFGVSSEVAGTTLVKFFSNMQSRAALFAKYMNVSTAEWVSAVDTDALGAFKRVTVALSEMDSAARADAINKLFGSGRIFSLATKFVNDAANGFEVLNRNLGFSTQGFKDGTSSIREYNVIIETLQEQTQLLRTDLTSLAIESGNKLLPTLKDVVKGLQEFAKSDDARDIFESLVESMGAGIVALRSFIEELSRYGIVWQNLLPALRVFVGLQIAKIILGISSSLVAQIVKVGNLAVSWRAAAASAAAYVKQSNAAQAVGALRARGARSAQSAAVAREAASARAAEAKAASDALQVASSKVRALEEERTLLKVNRNAQKAANAELLAASRGSSAAATAARRELSAMSNEYKKAIQTNTRSLQQAQELQAARQQEFSAVVRTGPAVVTATRAMEKYTAAQTRAARAPSPMAGIAVAAGAAGRGILSLGRTLLGFVGGPLGLAITGAILFGDKIAALLGFVTDVEELSRRRAAGRAREQAVEQANAMIDAYRDTMRKGVGEIQTDFVGTLASQGFGGLETQLKEVMGQFSKLSTAMAGAEVGAEVVGVQIDSWQKSLDRAVERQREVNRELEKYRKLRAAIPEQRPASPGQPARPARSFDVQLNERLTALQAEQKALDSTIEGSKEKLKQLRDAQEQVVADSVRLSGRLQFIVSQLGSTITPATLEFADFQLQIRRAQRDLEQFQREREKLKSEEGGADDEDVQQELAQRMREVDRRIEDARGEITILEVSAERARRQATVVESQIIDSLSAANLQQLEKFSQYAKSIETSSAVKVSSDSIKSITNAAHALATARDELRQFVEYREPIDMVLDRIKSAHDNIVSSANAARDSIAGFLAEVQRTIQANQLQDEFNRGLDRTNKLLGQRERLSVGALERIRGEASARGDTKRVAELDEEIRKTKKRYETEREANKALSEREQLLARLRALESEAEGLNLETSNLKSSDDLRRQLELQRKTEDEINAALLEQAKRREGLSRQAADLDKQIQKVGQRLLELSQKKVQTDPLAVGEPVDIERQVVSDRELQSLSERIAKTREQLIGMGADAKKGAADIGQAFTSELNTKLQTLNTEISANTETLRGFAEKGPEFKAAVSQITAAAAELVQAYGSIANAGKALTDDAFLKSLEDNALKAREAVRAAVGKIEANITIGANEDSLHQSIDSAARSYTADTARAPVRLSTDLLVNEQALQADLLKRSFDLRVNLIPENAGELGMSIPARARGGLIRGRGTTTSDSILARLSDHEYVIKAKSVKHYGVDFMNRLNRMQLPKFAQGGLVGGMAESFAAHGAQSGEAEGDTVNLNVRIGGRVARLRGDREQVRQFTNMMADLERGTS